MNYNTDGFNERMNYINNSNDVNKLNRTDGSNLDSSVAKMKIAENKPDMQTVNRDKKIEKEYARGDKDNFVLRNKNMMNANKKVNPNNPVSNALNRNMFNKF